MWVDVNKQERQNYMSQTNGCLMPGYTGHCPTLKFRFGRCYGTNTREIMQDLTSRGIFNRKPPAYRIEDYSTHKAVAVSKDTAIPNNYNDLAYRGKKHILGYTGYIPGLNFRYGKSYGRAADDSMAEFSAKQSELRRRKEVDKRYTRSKSAPKMEPIRKTEAVKISLREFEEKNKYKENHAISPEFPPIAGYTGHIPHMKGSETSLSQRYYCAAKKGLEILQREREDRHSLDKAADSIEKVLREAEGKYAYGRG